MSEWWTYRLSDLILFSPDVYYRSFALYHHRIWPAHLVLLLVIAVAAFGCRRSGDDVTRGQIVAAVLAACWVWIAVAFHLQSYSTINWAAKYFAVAFVIQAVLLAGLALRRGMRLDPRNARLMITGFACLAIASVAVGMLTGRQWDQVEFPGLTPDATAVATILALRLPRPAVARFHRLLPLAWCLVGGLTLHALHSPEAWWTWTSALLALVLTARRKHPEEATITKP